MTYSPVSPPPRAGLGLDVIYHNDKTGQDGVADVGIGPYCDDVCGMQTLLLLLDHHPGPVDCEPGPQTRAALVSYGLSRAIPYDPASVPQGPICAALIADYQMKFGDAAAGDKCPPGQWGVPPLCFGEKTEAPPSNLCPEGSYGHPPYCVSIPGATPAQPPPGATTCPEGTIGLPPNCYGLPTGLPPGLPALPPGKPTPPVTTPPEIINEVPPKPGVPAPPRGVAAWWGARSSSEKVALGVAGALVGVGLLSLALPKRRRPPAARPNRPKVKARPKTKRRKAKRPARALRATGKIITLKSGKRFGHAVAPKRYRRLGATRQSQYAWPQGYKYPVHDAKHCRAASRYFGKHKRAYPLHVRRTIARNINKCKVKFGVGGPKVLP